MDEQAAPSPHSQGAGGRPVDPWFKRLTFYSFLGGVAHLPPLPVIDDWLYNIVRRAMVRDLLTARNVQAGDRSLKILVQAPATGFLQKGCVYTLLLPWRAVTYTLKRLFRKVFFVLLIKSAADHAVRLFQEGYLIDYAIKSGRLSQEVLAGNLVEIKRVRHALDETNRHLNPHAVTNSMQLLFKGGRRALLQGMRYLVRVTRRDGGPLPDQVIEEQLWKEYKGDKVETFIDKMAALFWNDPDYLARLEEAFERQFTGG
jgi:hypothetical protein